MIIKSLVLRNYRRFAAVDIECPENIIGIIGRNGAGKTTLVEAIGWALYGNVIARTGKSDIRSQFAGEGENCSVELEFVYGGEAYRIIRQLKGKNATAEAAIYRAAVAEPEAVQERGVNDYVERLLRLDYRSFFASVFAKQRELAALSAMSAEERRRSIARLINIDRVDKARERVLADRLGKLKYVEGMRNALVDPGLLEAQILAAEAETRQLREGLKKEEGLAASGERALHVARTELERLAAIRDAWQSHQSRILSVRASVTENEAALRRARADLEAIGAAEQELAALAGPIRELEPLRREKERLDGEALRQVRREELLRQQSQCEMQIDALQTRIASLQGRQAEWAGLEAARDGLLRREAELEQGLAIARAEQQQWKSECAAIAKAGAEARAKKERIESLGPDGECPTCTQRLADHYAVVLEGMEARLAELRQEWQAASQRLAAAEVRVAEGEAVLRGVRQEKEGVLGRLAAVREAAAALDQLRADLEAVRDNRDGVARGLAALGEVAYDQTQHEAARARLAELEGLQRRADQLGERASRRAQVTEGIARIEGVLVEFHQIEERERAAQSQLRHDEERYQQAQAELDAATRDLLAAKERCANAREEVARSVEKETGLRTQKVQQEQKRAEITAAEEEIRYLDALDLHLKKFRLDLAGRIRPLLARRASELLALTTSGRYSRLELDEDYLIALQDGNHLFPLGRFSGGEQDLANLCLRVAISQILAERSGGAPINFIILDEIFGSQDEERKVQILNALGKLSSQFRQIFIITHVDSIKDQLPVIMEVSQADEERSQVRMV
ncbi:MAG TPA: SMC family ATPase [bacterium]|nr:SMC family ATPase [bacterium]HQJ64586.1 SMC family ATPase [bacterium]